MKCNNCNSNNIKKYKNGWFCNLCLTPIYKTKSYKLLYIGLLLFTSIITGTTKAPNINKFIGSYNINSNSVELTDSCVFQELLKQDVLFPEYALKSSVYETGHFTSNLCKNYNNLFGITYVKSKYQTGYIISNEGLKFGKYKSIKDCISHYKQIQQHYANNIDRKYSDNKTYTLTLKTIK